MRENSRTTIVSTQNVVVLIKNGLGNWGRDQSSQLPYQRSS